MSVDERSQAGIICQHTETCKIRNIDVQPCLLPPLIFKPPFFGGRLVISRSGAPKKYQTLADLGQQNTMFVALLPINLIFVYR
jgi:hypothetical protein